MFSRFRCHGCSRMFLRLEKHQRGCSSYIRLQVARFLVREVLDEDADEVQVIMWRAREGEPV